jgi:Fe-S-cluster containining protein
MAEDREFIQILDATMAEAVRKSGPWLVCRPGCSECCVGPFPITQLDARRLRAGLANLEAHDPERAARVRERARKAVEAMIGEFPGDPATGILDEDEAADERFATLRDEDPCPALDPAAGTCDLYSARPVTCRIFGPPVRNGSEALGVCELCFRGATDEQIAACQVEVDPDNQEADLLRELEDETGARGQTIVAFALV